MNVENLQTVKECDEGINWYQKVGLPVPPELTARRRFLLKQGVTVYGDFKARNRPTAELCDCIKKAADALLKPDLDAEEAMKPVMLYGKIQSGKTRAFVGILSRAFDRGVDIAVIYTKGTNALAAQTVSRMKAEFGNFAGKATEGRSCTISVHDVQEFHSQPPSNYELNTKRHIIVCKKEANNTELLAKIFAGSTLMRQKKVVVIDDEADFGGISFYTKAGEIQAGTNAKNITETVKSIPWCRNMLVTATPYSLYLQPDGMSEFVNGETRPLKPRHTQIVPTHGRYVGGQQYFVDSAKPESMFHSVFHPLSEGCVDVLGKRNLRYRANVATARKLRDFRLAILQYLVGTAIRSLQEDRTGSRYQSSLIVHVRTGKEEHEWQRDLIEAFLGHLSAHVFCEGADDLSFADDIRLVYEDFCRTRKNGAKEGLLETDAMPTIADVCARVTRLFADEAVHVQVVNSDEDVSSLLDASGQLELKHEANIFVGGNILDRGITIENLIGFVYGRSPKKMQMDTVLQHARMYGARKMDDMAVTRFHTTNLIHERLREINAMDETLREQFEKAMAEGRDLKDVFICYSKGKIVPCSPSKLLPASLATISPQSRHLPVGFQTDCATAIAKTIGEIDQALLNAPDYANRDEDGIFKLDRDTAISLLRKIRTTYIYNRPIDENKGLEWNVDRTAAILDWCLADLADPDDRGWLYCLRREDREMKRLRETGGFIDAPDDGRSDLKPARAKAIDRPLLMLFRENGRKEKGWRDAPFYWPVLLVQKNIRPAIYGESAE